MFCSRKFNRFALHYSMTGGPLSYSALGQGERRFWPRLYAKILKRNIFFMPAESCLVRKRRLKMVGNSGKSSAAVSDYLRISDRHAGARMVWIATLVVLIAAIRYFADDDTPRGDSFSP
jgi:hypothetical protein